jgi:hypothetical protein
MVDDTAVDCVCTRLLLALTSMASPTVPTSSVTGTLPGLPTMRTTSLTMAVLNP